MERAGRARREADADGSIHSGKFGLRCAIQTRNAAVLQRYNRPFGGWRQLVSLFYCLHEMLMTARTRLQAFGFLLHQTWTRFFADDTFQEGAALAYYTVFALPGLLVLITRSVGAFFGGDAVTGALYVEVEKVLGPQGAQDVQQMVAKASTDEGLSVAALVGLVTLVMAATGVFVSMQETLNQVWGVRARPARAWVKKLLVRARGLGLILSVGFLLLISLVAQTILIALGKFLDELLPGSALIWLHVVNNVTSLGLGTVLFASIFKFLPDVHIRWRDVWIGAIVTAVLFAIGKALIGLYLGHSNVGSIYGAAGTVIVLLAWVFYTSQILFFGAVFTRCYAERFGHGLRPAAHAVRIRTVEVEEDEQPQQTASN
jgi:membrane protein